MKVIAVDIGATSGRVMTVTCANSKISYLENHRFPNSLIEKEGRLFWDFEALINHIIKGIHIALQADDEIQALSIDTWAVDFGLLDREGNLLSLPLAYRDTHSFETQKELLNQFSFEKLYSITGIQNLHFNTIYQLYRYPLVKEADKILMIPDLIAYRLTGKMRLERTNLSTTALYNPQKRKISEELLELIGVRKEQFPEIIDPGEAYGDLNKDLFPELKRDIKVIACASHDTASAVLGANIEEDDAYLSSGTWSLLGMELKDPIITKESREKNFTNEVGYQHTIRFLKNTMGMFLINEVRNDFKKDGLIIQPGEIISYIEKRKGETIYLDLDDSSFETPGNMRKKIEEYARKTDQKPIVDPGDYFHSIYLSMAIKYRMLIENLEKITQRKIHRFLIVGGGNQAVVLNQYTANMLNRDVIIGSEEATILGNALAQFIALKQIEDVKEGRKIITNSLPHREYHPQDIDLFQKEYEQYQKITRKDH